MNKTEVYIQGEVSEAAPLPLKPRFWTGLKGRYERQGRKARFKTCMMKGGVKV